MNRIQCPQCELKFEFIDQDVNHIGRRKAESLIRDSGLNCPYCGIQFER